MRISQVLISEQVAEKIWYKHHILPDEAEEVLFSKPVIRRARDGRYLAIGLIDQYVTVIFEYNQGQATVITAYPSSDWQIRLYKRAKKAKK